MTNDTDQAGQAVAEAGTGGTARRLATESIGFLKAAGGLAGGMGRSRTSDIQPASIQPASIQPPPVASPPASVQTAASVLSVRAEITGTLRSPDQLQIHGTVKGDVFAGALTICSGGVVTGEIVAETVVVHGAVEGRIRARMVQLCAGAVVRGDIIHGALGIDTAAIFEGASRRSEDPMAANDTAADATRAAAAA